MRRRPERCVVGVTRIWRRAGVRHEVMRQKLWALRCASSGVMGTRARRPPGTLGGALATCLGGEPVRATRRVGNRSRPGSASLGAPRPSADRRHECSAFPASWPSSERIGGSAISVIKTLRLLVADLAQKTAQNCTKMPARRCPRTLALLLAAAAPAAVSSEAAHEWAGPQPASKGNKPTRARPRPHRSRDAGIFELNAGETYTWRAQKVRAGVPPRRARSARPPRRSPATSGRAFST